MHIYPSASRMGNYASLGGFFADQPLPVNTRQNNLSVLAPVAIIALLAVALKQKGGLNNLFGGKKEQPAESSKTTVTTPPEQKKPVTVTTPPSKPTVTPPAEKPTTKPATATSPVSKVSDGTYEVMTIDNPTNIVIEADDATQSGIQTKSGDALIVNGPLNSTTAGVTDGGIVQKGKITQAFKKPDPSREGSSNFDWNNGIFGRDNNGKYFLITHDQWKSATKQNPDFAETIDFAFQNGPMLVKNKAQVVTSSSDDKKIRSAMGVDDNGKMVVIYTEKPVTMKELADKCTELGLKHAIHLDSDSSWAGYIDPNSGDTKGNVRNGAAIIHIQK